MKALAAEIVEKLGKRLAWLGVEVRELTGKPPQVIPIFKIWIRNIYKF